MPHDDDDGGGGLPDTGSDFGQEPDNDSMTGGGIDIPGDNGSDDSDDSAGGGGSDDDGGGGLPDSGEDFGQPAEDDGGDNDFTPVEDAVDEIDDSGGGSSGGGSGSDPSEGSSDFDIDFDGGGGGSDDDGGGSTSDSGRDDLETLKNTLPDNFIGKDPSNLSKSEVENALKQAEEGPGGLQEATGLGSGVDTTGKQFLELRKKGLETIEKLNKTKKELKNIDDDRVVIGDVIDRKVVKKKELLENIKSQKQNIEKNLQKNALKLQKPKNIQTKNKQQNNSIKAFDNTTSQSFNRKQTGTDFENDLIVPEDNVKTRKPDTDFNLGNKPQPKMLANVNQPQGFLGKDESFTSIVSVFPTDREVQQAIEESSSLNVFESSVSVDQGSISSFEPVTTTEFVNRNKPEVTTFFESNPGFATAQSTEKSLQDVGVPSNAAETFGTGAGVGVSFGADLAKVVANPGKAASSAVQAASNPTKTISRITDPNTNLNIEKNEEGDIVSVRPSVSADRQGFREARSFGAGLLTVGSLGTASSSRLASRFTRIDAPEKPTEPDFNVDNQFQVGEDFFDSEPSSSDLSVKQTAGLLGREIGKEVRGTKELANKPLSSASNFVDRAKDLRRKADPSTGVGRKKRPGEITLTTRDKLVEKRQNTLDFLKGDIEPDFERTTEGKIQFEFPAGKRDNTVRQRGGDRVIITKNLLEGENVAIDPRTKEAVIKKPRGRKDVFKDKITNEEGDIFGLETTSKGQLDLKTRTKDKTPELDDSDFVRRIDDQDRRQDVESESVESRLLRDRDTERFDRRQRSRITGKNRFESSLGLGLGLQSQQDLGFVNVVDEDSVFVQDQDSRIINDKDQDQSNKLKLGNGDSDFRIRKRKKKRIEDERRKRKRDSDRKLPRDIDFPGIGFDSEEEEDNVFGEDDQKLLNPDTEFRTSLAGLAGFGSEDSIVTEKEFDDDQGVLTGLEVRL